MSYCCVFVNLTLIFYVRLYDMNLTRPIILAPMAGGIITTELCVAVADSGGLPFIASGYLSPEELKVKVLEFESKSNACYGINIFHPEGSFLDIDKYLTYEVNLKKHYDNDLFPSSIVNNDDFFYEKIDIAIKSKARYISFTFGHPCENIINDIKKSGKKVILYATSKAGVRYINDSQADIIGIQSLHAGGHQASVRFIDENNENESMDSLIEYSKSISNKEVIAAGGISTKKDLLDKIRMGASAVQIGTMFLLANESGTKNVHKYGLLNFKDRKTILTKSFTGKVARSINNEFIRVNDGFSIDGYPEVHHLTKGIRSNASKTSDPESFNLWAGEGFVNAYEDSAKNIILSLSPYIISCNDDTTNVNLKLCVVGGGPRGLALIERLISKYNNSNHIVSIHWIDDSSHGPGRIWNPYNPTYFLMNTVCSQLSAFPDESTGFNEKYIHGPTMYEWICSEESIRWLSGDEELLTQAKGINDNSYPSRSLYGAYLAWAAEKIILTRKSNIRISILNERVTEIVSDGESRYLITSSESHYSFDYIMLALGHINTSMSDNEVNKNKEFSSCGAYYIPPGDADLVKFKKINKNDNALFFGIGLTFFDYMEALTKQRGGEFYENSHGLLKYKPSGDEPNIYISSRTGVPYHARGFNEKKPNERWEPRFINEEFIKSLNDYCGSSEISFGKHLWCKVISEVELAYTLSELNDNKYESCIINAINEGGDCYKNKRKSLGLSGYGFPWDKVLNPKISNRVFYGIDEYQEACLNYLKLDIEHANGGNKSNPFKCALDVLRDIRNEVRMSTQGGGISDRSYQDELNYFYTPMNTFLSIGPPVQRIKELSALIQSGVAKILPPEMFFNYDKENRSLSIDFKEPFFKSINIDCVVEARQQKFIVSKSTDPLIKNLMKNGIISPHIYSSGAESGCINISHHSLNVIDDHGNIDDRLFCYGVPTEGITWGTAATIRPFFNSFIFQDAERIVNKITKDFHE